MTTKDLEKEIALAEDLKDKLDTIEGKTPAIRKKKVTQEVASPRDAEVNADIGEMDKMKNTIKSIQTTEKEQPVAVAYPDAVMHKNISFVKSGFRILAGVALCFGDFLVAGVLLIVAEVLGIVEELV